MIYRDAPAGVGIGIPSPVGHTSTPIVGVTYPAATPLVCVL
jgi:hypothetical protein